MALKDEMQEFQKFAQSVMLQNPSCYSNLCPGINNFIAEMWQVI